MDEGKQAAIEALAAGLSRSAQATIRGYFSQMVYTALEWAKIGPYEVLLVEGHEDLDGFLFDNEGQLVSIKEVQLKDLSAAINARSEDAWETVFNFILAFQRHHSAGRSCTLVFATTAGKKVQHVAKSTQVRVIPATGTKKEQRRLDLAIDVLGTWRLLQGLEAGERAQAEAALKEAVSTLFDFHLRSDLSATPETKESASQMHARQVKEGIEYIDGNGLWADFLSRVSWNMGSPGAASLLQGLREQLSQDKRFQDNDAVGLSYRLATRVFKAGSADAPGLRLLTRSGLAAEAVAHLKDIEGWATSVGFIRIEAWTDLLASLEERVAVTETEIAEIKASLPPKPPTGGELLARLAATGSVESHIKRSWDRYFHVRVAPKKIFSWPARAQEQGVYYGLGGIDTLAEDYQRLREEMAAISTSLNLVRDAVAASPAHTPPVITSLPVPPTIEFAPSEPTGLPDLGAVQDRIEEYQAKLEHWYESSERELKHSVLGSQLSPNIKEAYYQVLYRAGARIGFVNNLVEGVVRTRCPVWLLTSPAGRGKSTLLWRLCLDFHESGCLVVILTPLHLGRSRPLLDVAADELDLGSQGREGLLAIADELWRQSKKPTIIAIDAINESPVAATKTCALLQEVALEGAKRPYLRLLVACRDLYWEGRFATLRQALAGVVIVDDRGFVQPRLTTEVVGAYFEHFGVGGLNPEDVTSPELLENPFLFRMFCETYRNKKYDGLNPVTSTGLHVIETYIESRSEHLRGLDFPPALQLKDELTALAQAMLERVRKAQGLGHQVDFAVILAGARLVLSTVSESHQVLFDAVLDLDLVLRRELVEKCTEEVSFTFERLESYFRALATLSGLIELGVPVDSAQFVDCWKGDELSRDAVGMMVAVGLTRGLINEFPAESEAAFQALPAVVDLLGDDRVQKLEPTALARAGAAFGLLGLGHTAAGWARAAPKAKLLRSTLVLSLVVALPNRPLLERHRDVYAHPDLMEQIGRELEADLEELRLWVRSGFTLSHPELLKAPGRVDVCRAMLGCNCGRIREAAYEWLFWWGHRNGAAACSLALEMLDDPDFFVRERAAALLCGLLEDDPTLATEQHLLAFFEKTLALPPAERIGGQNHYFIVEFARRTILEYRDRAEAVLPADAWGWLANPERLRSPDEEEGWVYAASPPWKGTGPIGHDMAHYTFGHLFRAFTVRKLGPVVDQIIEELPALGYSEKQYESLDFDNHRVPLRQPGGEFRFERFGKLFAYQGAYVVLGRWAGEVAVKRSINSATDPFALAKPNFDYMCTLVPGPGLYPENQRPTVEFPYELTWAEYLETDEREYVRDFLSQFTDEQLLWGVAHGIRGNRRFLLKVEAVFVFPGAAAALSRKSEHLSRGEEFYGSVPSQELNCMDFHSVSRYEAGTPLLSMDHPVVSASVQLIRTLHDGDKALMSPSPVVVRLLDLSPLNSAGEYVSQNGDVVTAQFEWGDYRSVDHAHLMSIKTNELNRVAEAIGAKVGFCEYMDTSQLDDNGKVGSEHFYRRWNVRIIE